MQSLIAVIFKEDMDRAEAYRVELRGREELAGLVDCSKMVAAVCDKEGKVHLQYTHALAKDGALIGGVWGALIGFLFLNPLLGIVADRAGVDQDDIGLTDILGVHVSLPLHQGDHDLRVADIHLAAVGFDEKFASGARQGAQCIRIEFKFHVPNFRYSACISFLSGNCLNPSPNVS